mmetsp:Transcript_22428/g.48995  ORF Transcript_22428/g.48995 Transcript_22428/m.48995 type:complete len:379 (-) Transcript_22428:2321-3457(-)
MRRRRFRIEAFSASSLDSSSMGASRAPQPEMVGLFSPPSPLRPSEVVVLGVGSNALFLPPASSAAAFFRGGLPSRVAAPRLARGSSRPLLRPGGSTRSRCADTSTGWRPPLNASLARRLSPLVLSAPTLSGSFTSATGFRPRGGGAAGWATFSLALPTTHGITMTCESSRAAGRAVRCPGVASAAAGRPRRAGVSAARSGSGAASGAWGRRLRSDPSPFAPARSSASVCFCTNACFSPPLPSDFLGLPGRLRSSTTSCSSFPLDFGVPFTSAGFRGVSAAGAGSASTAACASSASAAGSATAFAAGGAAAAFPAALAASSSNVGCLPSPSACSFWAARSKIILLAFSLSAFLRASSASSMAMRSAENSILHVITKDTS